MKIYLFSPIETPNRAAFRADYVFSNLKVVKSFSLIYFIVILAFRLFIYYSGFNIDKAINVSGFSASLYTSIYVIPVFYILSYLLIHNFRQEKNLIAISQALVVLFSLYLLSRGMINTFNAAHNPRNTMTMYMLWLVIICILFVFEYYETLFVIAISISSFAFLLPHYLTDQGEIFKNNFVAATLLCVFFFASRYVFTYRATHFSQLKTIQEKNQQIENAIHLKDEILGIVAHDLRNPLSAIESIAMLMELDSDILDDNILDNLMMIKASCEKARFIINDLIEVARNDNDNVDNFGVEKAEVNGFLSEIVAEWEQSSGAKLMFKQTDEPIYVWINKEKMQRVMDNLISNAIKFSVDGNPVEIFLKQFSGKCFIHVKDRGLGIPKDMIPYIFDRFSRASRKGIRGEDSVGLGLSIVRQIIRKHGGDITVDSVEKQGTTFTIMLPQSSVLLSAAG